MPTWSVVVRGSIVELRTLFHADFDYQTLYPCPYRDALGEPMDDRCYAWCEERWGSRDSAVDIRMSYDEEASVLYVELVAEALPVGLFKSLGERFPKIEITSSLIS